MDTTIMFGRQVHDLRKARDLTQEALAEQVGCSVFTLKKIEQGRLRLDLQPVTAAELVEEAVERFEARAQEKGIALETDLAAGLPEVRADRERVGHVFDNLLSNALRHTDRGGRVRLSARAEGDFARFDVEDTALIFSVARGSL